MWLHRRRQDAGQGVLSPIYKQGLSVIPGSDKASNRKVDDETRWQQRLSELEEYLAVGNGWPLHKKAASEQERMLGVWIHVPPMKHRRDQLDRAKKERLNDVLPGWRTGRGTRPQESNQ